MAACQREGNIEALAEKFQIDPESESNVIGGLFDFERAAHGLSVADLAGLVKQTRPTVYAMRERPDKRWTLGDLSKYAKLLGFEVSVSITPIEKPEDGE